MTFFTGQEVVCIDDTVEGHGKNHPFGVTKGEVYIVRWVGKFDHYVFGQYLGLRLVGIHRGEDEELGYDDPPFQARRFRPVVKDPLEVFRAIAADPDGFVVQGPEGPVRKVDDRPSAPIKEEERV